MVLSYLKKTAETFLKKSAQKQLERCGSMAARAASPLFHFSPCLSCPSVSALIVLCTRKARFQGEFSCTSQLQARWIGAGHLGFWARALVGSCSRSPLPSPTVF